MATEIATSDAETPTETTTMSIASGIKLYTFQKRKYSYIIMLILRIFIQIPN